MRNRLATAFALALVVAVLPGATTNAQVVGADVTYTTDAEFDQGTLVSVNHDAPNNDQLQLDSPTEPFPFINVAASGRGTVVRINTETGEVIGEYRTAPEGRGLNPSRTTVDLFGSVWTANRGEVGEIGGVAHGSAVKIGLIVGGTRVDAAGVPDPTGEYLAPPFGYSTCSDRDGDGLIRTSQGLLDILDWPDISDGLGGADGLVEDAYDECILLYQRLPDAEQARHVSVDADNNVWVGGFPFDGRMFYKLDGATGAILDSFDARDFGCGGYGGLVDGNGVVWSIGWGDGEGPLLRYDPATGEGMCVDTKGGYGLGVDTNGYIWASLWSNGIAKVSPDGELQPGFPKPTWPIPSGAMAAPAYTSRGPLQAAPAMAMVYQAEIPSFLVSPQDDWVQSQQPWTSGATISMTIEDGTDVVYSDSQTADGDGHFNFNLWDIFDVQRGHVVAVSDGTTTKTHTVANLFVDGLDVSADTVFGRADAGTQVHVWVDGYDGIDVTADGSGNWTANFSGTVDIDVTSSGGAQQVDGDDDFTTLRWAYPSFMVSPQHDWVQSNGPWPPGADISLTIEDGGGVVYSDSQTADGDGRFNFSDLAGFDLQRGHVVTVSDGATTKAHTVTNLFVDGFDASADTVFGRADAGSLVHVWVDGYDGIDVTADGSGNWTANFSGTADIEATSSGGAQQGDDDNDYTNVPWANPSFQVAPDDDWVQSSAPWTPGTTISLTIDDGGAGYTDSQTADGEGYFNFSDLAGFDLKRGHVVTVSDGTTTKTHMVEGLFVDGVDVTLDTVFGRAAPGSSVDVWVHDDGQVMATADGSGNWTADFSGMADITYASDGGSQVTDVDGDSTGVWWWSPSFQVAPDDEWIQSQNPWTPGATISLTIEDGGGVVYSDSQTADSWGNFNFGLWDVFDIERGHLVTVSDGTTTKTHTVEDLFVDGVDVTADTVFGRAAPGSSVDVWVHDDGQVMATADGSGNWTADFSGMADITYASDGGSQVTDVDGDSTGVWWSSPRFQANPDRNWVASITNWTPDAMISLTIEDGGGVEYTDSQTADSWGNFHFELGGFDLERGHVVTVSDGTITKTHTVIDLYADSVDVNADTVSGRAPADSSVNVWTHGEGVNVAAAADSTGAWTADFAGIADITFNTEGGAEQSDDDGDSTSVEWFSPRFQVQPDNDSVGSWGYWDPGTAITLNINGGAYTDTTTTDGVGEFWFELQGDFDVERGDAVTVSGGTIAKNHTVRDLYITDVDRDNDVVAGTAPPGSEVTVEVEGEDGGWITVTADPATGVWVADYSTVYDIGFNTHVAARQSDDEGDVTWVDWRLPMFEALPQENYLRGGGWVPNTPLEVSIDDGDPGTEPYSTTATTNEWGDFDVGTDEHDLVTGDIVTVGDGTTTKVHTVTGVNVTDIDYDNDVVSGIAAPNAELSVTVGLFDEWSGRSLQADSSGNWTADFSVPADDQPTFDLAEAMFVEVQEYDDDGDATHRQFGAPTQANRGVAVTPIDNHVWVANSGVGTVTRLDNDGNILRVIPTGDEPTGVAVDAAGKVWVTNLQSDNTVRIDPNAGTGSLGAVDLTVDLGEGASPYNYSDMTGAVVVGSTSPQGFWTVVQDSGVTGFEWGRLTWNTEPEAFEPPGTEIVVEVRTSDSEAGLGGTTFFEVPNGELFSSFGRYIEVRVTLKASPDGLSPILSDIRVQPAIIEIPIDIKPTSCPNPFNVDQGGVMPVAILGTADFDASQVDPASVMLEGVSPLRWSFEDIATPFEPYVGRTDRHDCSELGADGYMDLTFKFNAKELAAAIGDVTDGDVVVLTVTGVTFDQIPIVGEDVVVILTKK